LLFNLDIEGIKVHRIIPTALDHAKGRNRGSLFVLNYRNVSLVNYILH